MLKLGLLSLFTMTLAAAACGDNPIDRAYDCDQICDKYKECADANYDDDACADRCRDEAANSSAYEDQADACQSCIDDMSCVGSAFNCSTECGAIVP